MDQGTATISIEQRSVQRKTSTTEYSDLERIYHLDVWQNLPNMGNFSLWADWAEADLNNQRYETLGRGFIGLSGFRSRNFMLDGLLGDSSIIFTNLPEKFANSTYPNVYFRGSRLDTYSQWGNFSLFGGRVAKIIDMLGKIYDPTEESFYGFKSHIRLVPMLLLGTGFILTQNEVDNANQPLTKNNRIFLLDSQLEIQKSLQWLAEFRGSDFTGESGMESQRDYAWKTGPRLKTETFRLEANYRRTGTDYRFVNEATQGERDQEGLFFLAEYKPWKELAFFGNADRFHNNVSNKPDRNATDTQRGLLGVSFFHPSYPSSYLAVDRSEQKSRLAFPSPEDNSTTGVFSEIRAQYRNFNPYLRYRWRGYQDGITVTNGYNQNVFTLGNRWIINQGSMVYIEGEIDWKDYENNDWEEGVSGKFGFYYSAPPKLSFWGEVIYSKLKDRSEDSRRDLIEGSLGLSYLLPWDLMLYCDLRSDRVLQSDSDSWNSQGFQVTFRLAKKFSWGKPEKTMGLPTGVETRGYGTVEGTVFNDINRNGVKDPGEEGVKDVLVRLEDGSTVKTDARGFYRFERVEAGRHMVNLDVRKIPAEYSILSSEKAKIEVKLRETVAINFQLIAAGRIEGRVINDLNGNGKWDPDEKGMADVLVILTPGDSNTYTDEEGRFSFENILPGGYSLKLDPFSLPADAVMTSASESPLQLPVGGDMKDNNFLIHVKPRPVIIGPPTK